MRAKKSKKLIIASLTLVIIPAIFCCGKNIYAQIDQKSNVDLDLELERLGKLFQNNKQDVDVELQKETSKQKEEQLKKIIEAKQKRQKELAQKQVQLKAQQEEAARQKEEERQKAIQQKRERQHKLILEREQKAAQSVAEKQRKIEQAERAKREVWVKKQERLEKLAKEKQEREAELEQQKQELEQKREEAEQKRQEELAQKQVQLKAQQEESSRQKEEERQKAIQQKRERHQELILEREQKAAQSVAEKQRKIEQAEQTQNSVKEKDQVTEKQVNKQAEELIEKIKGKMIFDKQYLEKQSLPVEEGKIYEEITTVKQEKLDLENRLKKLKNYSQLLEIKAKELYLKSQDAEQIKTEYQSLKLMVENLNKERLVLNKKNDELQRQVHSFEKESLNEKATLYQQLGTAYVQAKIYDLAVDCYKKSIKLNPDNAELYYNLGLLYKHCQSDNNKSIYYFKKFLQLNPKAKNRAEVEYFIGMLQSEIEHKIE